MSQAPATGWLFKGVELGGAAAASSAPEGLTLTPAGRIAMITGDAGIRQSIVMLLTTIPGERVMRPDYGCPLDRLMFSPNDATTAGLAIHYVRQALIRFEPRVEIVALDALAGRVRVGASSAGPPSAGEAEDGEEAGDDVNSDDDARLVVELVYRVKSTSRVEHVQFELDLESPS